MTAAKQLLDDKFLKNFAPLGDLDAERFNKIARHCTVEQYDAGTKLFQIGDRDNRTLYLMSGQVTLTFRSGTQRIITAETNQARNALVPEQPRQASATAKTAVSLLVIDSDILDQVMHWSDSSGYEIAELEANEQNDWMTMFLQSKAFLKLRAQNIQALMMRLEEIPVKAGHVIVKQGDDDGYYYIVKRGKCRVTRKPTPNSPEIEVAVLSVGAGFGEEALIMHDARGATVTMVESGQLMRLSRSDFTRLLAEPLVQIVNYKDVVKNPKTVFLDVRTYEEYVSDGIRNSENSPLPELRAKIDIFDSHKQYVIVSNDGGRASAAAFLLCQQGLDAVVLERGLLGLPDDVLRGNGNVDDLNNIPTVDNVVSFNKSSEPEVEDELADKFNVFDEYDELEELEQTDQAQVTPAAENEPLTDEEFMSDPRVNAIFTQAKERLTQEARKSKAADQARTQAEKELARLRSEAEEVRIAAEKARKEAELAVKQSAKAARLDASKEAARLREKELACKQAEVEEAIRQAEEEAQRAHYAEVAYREAQEENARLKTEMQEALEHTKEEARKSSEAFKIFAEQEARRYRDAAKKRAHDEKRRIREADKARRKAEAEIKKLKYDAQTTRRKLEEQAKLAVDAARTEAQQQAARLHAEELATQQAQQEELIRNATLVAERAEKAEKARRKAESEIEKMRLDVEIARTQSAEQARIAADQARSEAEQEAARQKAQVLAEKQLEIEEAVRRAEEESSRARAAEEARRLADEEIARIRQEAASEKARVEEQALRIAEQAREIAERKAEEQRKQELAAKQVEIDSVEQKAREEAERAQVAEEARLKAEAEIERLKLEAEQTQQELQKQLTADISRSTTEHEVARARAEELVNKQSEIDEIARVAEEASLRAMAAEEARYNSEQEIERLKAEIEQAREAQENANNAVNESLHLDEAELARKQAEILAIGKTIEEEARRVKAAEDAQLQAQEEINRLRKEVEFLTKQAQEQLNADVQRAAIENEAVREQARELEQKQKQIETAILAAQQQAQRAQDAIEARIQAEEEVKQLKAQTDEAQEMLRRSEQQSRKKIQREIEQARAEEAARRQAEVEEAARNAREEARRAEIAEKARLEAEREIERLKAAAEVQRIKAEKAIKESIKTAHQTADNKDVVNRNNGTSRRVLNKQEVNDPVGIATDFFANEPQTDLEAQDDMNLLFTDIDVGEQPKGASDRIKAMKNEPKKQDEAKTEEEAPASSWVSDQVMWEAALGIRQDDKVQQLIAPNSDNDKEQFFRREVQNDEERKADRPLFEGREVNYRKMKQPASIPVNRRRRLTSLIQKGKILLWLSPLLLAVGYYFTLSEQQRIGLQLTIAETVSGKSVNDRSGVGKDIAKDAQALIEETEARISAKKDGGKAKKKSDPVKQKSKPAANKTAVKATPKKQPVTVKPKTFSGRDIPFEETATPVTAIQAPLPQATVETRAVPQDSRTVLPPIPDATAASAMTAEPDTAGLQQGDARTATEVTTRSRNTSSVTVVPTVPTDTLPQGVVIEKVPDNVDVNAEQNTATFHKTEDGNLETIISQ
ncbi:cyclic nucleotide-binding domain-containing protein [Kaarinaea lacus]